MRAVGESAILFVDELESSSPPKDRVRIRSSLAKRAPVDLRADSVRGGSLASSLEQELEAATWF